MFRRLLPSQHLGRVTSTHGGDSLEKLWPEVFPMTTRSEQPWSRHCLLGSRFTKSPGTMASTGRVSSRGDGLLDYPGFNPKIKMKSAPL